MNIRVKRDNDRGLKITISKDGAAKNITGWTIFFSVKKRKNDTDDQAIIFKEVTSHTNPTAGETYITIDAADTKTEKVGIYPFDIKAVDDQGKKQSSETGTFEIVQEVTDGDA